MPDASTLERGQAVPPFDVTTLNGDAFSYGSIWQRQNLVLVALPASSAADTYAAELSTRAPEFHDRKSALILTRDQVSGLAAPGALIADRWGEIVYVATVSDTAGLPSAEELLEWLDYVEKKCPECEGEAR